MRPVGREDVQVLVDKKRSTGAQKAILFSTNGFQKGALDYARIHGVALVRVLEGKYTYETKSMGMTEIVPLPWLNIQPFVGELMHSEGKSIHSALIEPGRLEPLSEYLKSG